MHSKIAAFLLPLLAAANPLPQGTGTTPQPGEITIIEGTYSGNGCPQGSVSTTTSPDKTVSPSFHGRRALMRIYILPNYVITYGFDAFQAYIGPGTKLSDHSKNCQLHLNLKYPGGFQYAVVDATYHGWARLDDGVTGQFLTTYFFSQDASRTSTTKFFASGGGALATGQVYTKNDKIETTATIWSPCGGTGILNVNNRLSLTSKNSALSGELSNDDATVAFTQQLHVAWRPCTPGSGNTGGGGDTIGIGKPNTEVDFGN